jgi:hypothetical protein
MKACEGEIPHSESSEAGRSANDIWDSEKLPHICCAKIVRETCLRERNMREKRETFARKRNARSERSLRKNKTRKTQSLREQ